MYLLTYALLWVQWPPIWLIFRKSIANKQDLVEETPNLSYWVLRMTQEAGQHGITYTSTTQIQKS